MTGAEGPKVQRWLAQRSWNRPPWTAGALVAHKAGRTISVVLPALNEAETIGPVLDTITPMVGGLVDELVVLDSGSTDDTEAHARAAGARVVRREEVLPELPVRQGKGEALWRSLAATTGDIIVFIDSDLLDPDPLFASLEVGGSETPPDDPALARLFPDAYEGAGDASQFRRVTEQGLVNRKLQDALEVSGSLGVGSLPDAGGGDDPQPVELDITDTALPAWARTLTALRLAIAARLGIGDEADHTRLAEDEETRGTLLVYDWLAAILDSLLRMGPSD